MYFTLGIAIILTGIFVLYWTAFKKRKFIPYTCSQIKKLSKTKPNIPVEVTGKIVSKSSVMPVPEPTQITTSMERYTLKDSTGEIDIEMVSGWREWLKEGDIVRVRGLLLSDFIQPIEIENLTTGKKQTKTNWVFMCLIFIGMGFFVLYSSGFKFTIWDLIEFIIIMFFVLIFVISWAKKVIIPTLKKKR